MSSAPQLTLLPLPSAPPKYCEYAGGACDQSFAACEGIDGLFLYPSDPPLIASTIEAAVGKIRLGQSMKKWQTWKDLGIGGQIIFCQVCKAIRFSKLVIADVTTLNFNLMFEIGYAIGCGIPVLPIRDTSFAKDLKAFEELGLLDTLGYIDFQNSAELAEGVLSRLATTSPVQNLPSINAEQPLFLLNSHIQTEGTVKLVSALNKSGLKFRAFDTRETARLSLHTAIKQVHSSTAVIVHLLSLNRAGATVHNSRCAFVAGLGLAAGKEVLMLQESAVAQPIDYRDVIRTYASASEVPTILVPLVRRIVENLQRTRFVPINLPLKPLEKVDVGDLAAENEIRALDNYFVPTGQYNEAKRGRARLVVGRKGSGKTAIFYGVRTAYAGSKSHMVLDLKPEGHQFTKLREAVLSGLTPGFQQHVLTAFWNYLLLMELAHSVVQDHLKGSYRDSRLRKAYLDVCEVYGTSNTFEQGDFSERLLNLVNDIAMRKSQSSTIKTGADVTNLVYKQDIRTLSDSLSEYLSIARKEDVWLLFDNLDKGWPIQSALPEDILLVRSLLDATRKLQRQFENRNIEFHSIVFIRDDIYRHLILEPADRGKDTTAILDWSDIETFKELVRKRITLSTGVNGGFEQMWASFFDPHVHGEESFSYLISRTQLRPRELLRFIRECVDIGVSRGHDKVLEADILFAEKAYSDDSLVDLTLELKDVRPEYEDVAYEFIGCRYVLCEEEVNARIRKGGVPEDRVGDVRDLLVWFGLLGIWLPSEEERYSYRYLHDAKKLNAGVANWSYCIHPAYRSSLGCLR